MVTHLSDSTGLVDPSPDLSGVHRDEYIARRQHGDRLARTGTGRANRNRGIIDFDQALRGIDRNKGGPAVHVHELRARMSAG
jgi:hypothetical protein